MMQFPLTYKAVILPEYNNNLLRAMVSLKISEKTMDQPNENELVVKVLASPVNPSDIAFLRGGYNIKKPLPATPGFEGSGKVVEAGSNHKHLIGSTVSFFSQDDNYGAWAEYIKLNAESCIVTSEEQNQEQAACFSINPLTALGLIEEAELMQVDTILLTAAGSRVAEFLRKLAELKNMKTINLIRNETKALLLQKSLNENIHNVLNISSIDELNSVENLFKNHKPIMVFDAVGGAFTGKLFSILPKNSSLVLYGALNEGDIQGIDPIDLIFNNKTLKGFNLNNWVKTNKQSDEFLNKINFLEKLFLNQTLNTPIRKSYRLAEINLAIRDYIKDMSGGKILIKP